MRVFKLGGSLYQNPQHCAQWLVRVQQAAQDGPVLLVPGGGPFADAVRSADAKQPLTAQTAHQMALLAMHQWGLMLADKLPNVQWLHALHHWPQAAQGLWIWGPTPADFDLPNVPASWAISADSLSVIAATQLQAEELLVVKSCAVTPSAMQGWVDSGVLDAAFATYRPHFPGRCGLIAADAPEDWYAAVCWC